jgi:predicted RNase H-like HicB family nuclease
MFFGGTLELSTKRSYNCSVCGTALPRRFAMMFHVVLHPEEEGWIVAECPALPGCVSQGKDEKEALINIREAITGWLWAEDQKAADSLPAGQMPLLVAV